jgi:MFS transporter
VRHGSSTALRFTAAQTLLVAAEVVLECSRDCVLLAHFSPTGLPWVSLAITALVGVAGFVQSRAGERSTDHLPRLVGAAGLVTLTMWWFRCDGPWMLGALSAGTAFFTGLLFVQLSVRADACGWKDRPQTFSFIAAGGPLGALLGAGAARLVLGAGSPRPLLLISAILSLLAAALIASLPGLRPARETEHAETELRSVGKALARDRAVRPLVIMGILAALAGALADVLFKQRLVSELSFDRIPPILAGARMGQAALVLGIQLVATRWLRHSGGVVRGLVLLPAGLFLLSQGMSVGVELAMCVLARVLEGGLRRSMEPRGVSRRCGSHRRFLRRTLEVTSQRLGQTAAMGVVLGAAGLKVAPGWLVAVLAMSTLGWLEWGDRLRRAIGS